jgi:transposase-like protein
VDKVPVFAFVERGGARLFTTAKDVTESTILALVEQRIEPGSKAYTDEYPPYKTLNTIYNHESVDHSIGEYVRGGVHINTCEADFSILRPFTALHRGVAKYNYTPNSTSSTDTSATQRAYKHYNKQSKQPYS